MAMTPQEIADFNLWLQIEQGQCTAESQAIEALITTKNLDVETAQALRSQITRRNLNLAELRKLIVAHSPVPAIFVATAPIHNAGFPPTRR